MSLTFDLYVPARSWIHTLDPRVKLWGATAGLMVAFLLPTIPWQLGGLACIALLLRYAGIPWQRMGWVARQMAVPLLLILLLQPFFEPAGQVLLLWGPLRVTLEGLLVAVQLALRALLMALVAGGLLFTTDPWALVQGLVALGLPYSWGLMLSLTLRFLPALGNLFEEVREAQAARGWVAEGRLWRRLRDYLPVLVAVIIRTLRLSDALTLALAARGLEGQGKRTSWRTLHMQARDWIAVALIGLALFTFLYWRLASGSEAVEIQSLIPSLVLYFTRMARAGAAFLSCVCVRAHR